MLQAFQNYQLQLTQVETYYNILGWTLCQEMEVQDEEPHSVQAQEGIRPNITKYQLVIANLKSMEVNRSKLWMYLTTYKK